MIREESMTTRNANKRPTGSVLTPTVQPNPTTLQVLGVGEVATMLGVPISTVYEMCRFRGGNRGNQIPYRRVGRYTKFLKHEVEAWLLNSPLQTRTTKRAYRKQSVAKLKATATT